jgi:hypothetical protein
MDRVIESIDSQNFFESTLIDVAQSIQNETSLFLTALQWECLRKQMTIYPCLYTVFELWGYECYFSKPEGRFIMTHAETNKRRILYIYYIH